MKYEPKPHIYSLDRKRTSSSNPNFASVESLPYSEMIKVNQDRMNYISGAEPTDKTGQGWTSPGEV
jgi:hypothetical protein